MHKIWINYVTTSESEVRATPMTEGDECGVKGFIFFVGGYKVSEYSQRLRKISKSLRIT